MKNKEKKFFPLFTDLTEKKALVVGAGKIASRRIRTMLSFVGEMTVVAPQAEKTVLDLAAEGKLTYVCKAFEPSDLSDIDLVLAATDAEAVNESVYHFCKERKIPVNVASNQEHCDFQFPGMIEYDGVVIGFNGAGKNHRKVKEVREKTERALGRLKEESMKKIVIGSRESKLAVVQSEMVKSYIETHCPETSVEILTMKTTGDKILDRTLDKIGGKGLFVKELDKALLEKRSDLSVHSLKDMPMEVPKELPLLAFSKREDPRDALVLPEGVEKLDPKKPIGCSSARRILQLKELYPEMECKSVRGNVQTRLAKLDGGEYSALILAAAGLKRLGLEHRISRYFEPEEMIPAAGQGILAVQGRAGEDASYLEGYGDRASRQEALAERAFVRFLDGGCSSPIAAHGKVSGEELTLLGLYYDEAEETYVKGSITGNGEEAEELGISLAKQLKRECGQKKEEKP